MLWAPLAGILLALNKEAAALVSENPPTGPTRDKEREQTMPLLEFLSELGLEGRSLRPPCGLNPDEDRSFLPTSVTLFATDSCNLRCRYCYARGGETDKTISFPVAKNAVDLVVRNAKASNSQTVAVGFHGGGEPTVAMDLLERVALYARTESDTAGLELHLSLATNGVISTEAAEWVASNISSTTLSFDGLPSIQDSQRPSRTGRPTSHIVQRTMRVWDQTGHSYGIRATVGARGVHEMENMVKFLAANSRASALQLEPVHSCGRAAVSGMRRVEPELFIRGFRAAQAASAEVGLPISYSGFRIDFPRATFCGVAGRNFFVRTDGMVSACCEVTAAGDGREDLFVFGLFDKDQGDFVFDANALRRLRELRVERMPTCSSCFCKWTCSGDCPAKRAIAGDPWDTVVEDRCQIVRALTEDGLRRALSGASLPGELWETVSGGTSTVASK